MKIGSLKLIQLVKMRSGWSRVGPKHNMTNIFIRSSHVKIEMEKEHTV